MQINNAINNLLRRYFPLYSPEFAWNSARSGWIPPNACRIPDGIPDEIRQNWTNSAGIRYNSYASFLAGIQKTKGDNLIWKFPFFFWQNSAGSPFFFWEISPFCQNSARIPPEFCRFPTNSAAFCLNSGFLNTFLTKIFKFLKKTTWAHHSIQNFMLILNLIFKFNFC